MRTTRRTFVRASLATAPAALLPISLHAQEGSPARRLIPATREAMPIVGLVARFSQIEGYKCFSLTRALDVVKCQLALV
jgi:hypothetical protein